MGRTAHSFLVLFSGVAMILGLGGCTTDAFCFSDCESSASSSSGHPGSGSGGSGVGGCFPNCSTSTTGTGGAGGGGGCMPTNGGIEICDGKDNDCNGKTDDIAGLDLKDPKTCGICSNNCYVNLLNNDPATITCTPSPNPGQTPGTCQGMCAADYHDLDKNGSCEYYCVQSAPDDKTCNYVDDDCDGVKDEDVDLCTSVTDCGQCGHNCVVLHGTPVCVPSGAPPCTPANTACQIQKCDCNGPGDCWWDLDKNPATGCEYQCDITNGGVEICDGKDNDCDGKIDGADDLSGDPTIGVPCFGAPVGVCADPMHAGATACSGGQVVCAGPNVLVPGQLPETCNNKDDDCDGTIDNNPTDAGKSCGVSNIFPCTLGTQVCMGGALVCVGAVNPGTETCNGIDDDCDGQIDKSNNQPPADSVGMCNIPLPPPAGATSPCKAGSKACVGGTVQCVGSVGPTGPDTCGVDANCDGVLTNQPDTMNDVHNCGSCGHDCLAGAVHANWTCSAGMCVFQSCQTGYYDLDNDKKCEYPCVFVSAQETCNGVDDNCNGQVDEGVIAPTPVQVCGVTVGASSPECTSGVTVTCNAGSWKCTFPAGICNPTCASATETCDGKDNNCNGLTDENVPNIGKPCASDDGLPAPGDGACRTTGTYVCNGPNGSKCNAVKDLAKAGPELCDGVDNDCDGLVDEPYTNKGSNATYFVKPGVTKITNNRWIMSYEASRPSATGVIPGAGNGYFTSAPAGVTLDKTPACSVPSKIPWYDVSGVEVEQSCQAIGGFICTPADWQTACHAKLGNCNWGYAPATAATCSTALLPNPPNNPGKYCNLGVGFDFDPVAAGIQNGLLPTASAKLSNCYADWTGVVGNPPGIDKVYDMTGNLREFTKLAANQYTLFGGAFDAQDENGASCNFTFYTVDQNFKFHDTGFRCCFSSDPTL